VREVIARMTAGVRTIRFDDLPPRRVVVHVLSEKGSNPATVTIEPDGLGSFKVSLDPGRPH
jgi:hypothetical protein